MYNSLFSSVVEHWSRKPGVMGSIPIGGSFCPCFQYQLSDDKQLDLSKGYRSWQGSNLRGQSPLDFKSNALTTRPQLLATVSDTFPRKTVWRCGGSNPGPFTCKANALPLSYIPTCIWAHVFQSNKALTKRHPASRRNLHDPANKQHKSLSYDKTPLVPTGGLEPPIFGLGDRRLIH